MSRPAINESPELSSEERALFVVLHMAGTPTPEAGVAVAVYRGLMALPPSTRLSVIAEASAALAREIRGAS